MTFYKDDFSLAEYKESYAHWSKVARNEFTWNQIVETAHENMSLSSPVWHAMQDELLYRDELDRRKVLRKEAKIIRNGGSAYGLNQTDKPKKRTRKSLKTKEKKQRKMTL